MSSRIAVVLIALIGGKLPLVAGQTRPPARGPDTVTVRIELDAPGAPRGTPIRVNFLKGPDSLQGLGREYAAPVEFTLRAPIIAFNTTRAHGLGTVSVKVQRLSLSQGTREGPATATGEHLGVYISPESIDLQFAGVTARGLILWAVLIGVCFFAFGGLSFRLSRR